MNDLLSFRTELRDPAVKGEPTRVIVWAHRTRGNANVCFERGGLRVETFTDAAGARALAETLVQAADAIDAYREHIDDNHEQRAEDGIAGPVPGCAACEENPRHEQYFADMYAARREYDARPQHDDADHERGHEERPLVGMAERA